MQLTKVMGEMLIDIEVENINIPDGHEFGYLSSNSDENMPSIHGAFTLRNLIVEYLQNNGIACPRAKYPKIITIR